MAGIYLTEDDVLWLLDIETAIEAVERAFRNFADGRAMNQPRRRVAGKGVQLHAMTASDEGLGYLASKQYTTTRNGARFLVTLWNGAGEVEAVIEANHLGQIRTGATSGVATRVMARPDAAVVGCIGTGFQARMQLKAISTVRRISRVEVYGRDADRREKFAAQMGEYCNTEVVAVHSPDAAAAEKDIVVTATTSSVPVFDGKVLAEGTHVNAVGSNYLAKTEIDCDTIRLADHIVCDSREACQLEAGDFVPALEAGQLEWSRVHELGEVLTGRQTGRAHPEDITLFKSVGLGLEDLAVAVAIVAKAKGEGMGTPLPF